ncbi:uncharacterized protein STEHIDRAFT_155992 [Stereum hirsutum FP-91666 SS1]|uniref:uncharacterized protein n=1 Tax=Stereum hirsutum (strain FP-91666) TaxID=721885 RepID=UPI000440AAC1|nr:uncharacterized protein STEHIDRAFT_155992 [Stereum hirsutum FP-91666 SS1]EIM86997.1 hypothetical protein STEHIDRAFT_155992 [Stereum hirsutum FP-91666 SS1]
MEFLENQCNYTAPKIELAVYPTVESDEYTGKILPDVKDAPGVACTGIKKTPMESREETPEVVQHSAAWFTGFCI